MIETFYKYRPILNDDQLNYALELIIGRKLYLSSTQYFSDPFDGFISNESNLKIVSLTKNDNSRLLWAYYTGWYKGIMVKLNIDLSRGEMKKLRKVEYLSDKDIVLKRLSSGDHYVKFKEFQHEQEYRLILNSDNSTFKLDDRAINEITIGPCLDQKYEDVLLDKCSQEGVSVYKYDNVNGIPVIDKRSLCD